MPTPQETVDAVRSYLRMHPEELGRAVRSALGLRFGVPLAALRWLGEQAQRAGKVEDFQIDSVPPGLRLAGNVDLMNTPIRAGAVIYVERVVFNDEELTVALRLEDVSLKLNGDSDSPIAALIKDLKSRGLLDSTLIVWMGEFGRTPRINSNTGRDHFPAAWSCVLAGGGIRGGQAYGKTSKDGTQVVEGKVDVGDVLSTLCTALGVPPDHENFSKIGRPIKIAEGSPIREILG